MSYNPYDQSGFSEQFGRGFELALQDQKQSADQRARGQEADYRNQELDLSKQKLAGDNAYQNAQLGIEGRKLDMTNTQLQDAERHQRVLEDQGQQHIKIAADAAKNTAGYQQAELSNSAARLGIERDQFTSDAAYKKAMATVALSKPDVQVNLAMNREIAKMQSDPMVSDKDAGEKQIRARYQPLIDHATAIQSPYYSYGVSSGNTSTDDTETPTATPTPPWRKSGATGAPAKPVAAQQPSIQPTPPGKLTPGQQQAAQGAGWGKLGPGLGIPAAVGSVGNAIGNAEDYAANNQSPDFVSGGN